MGREAEILRRAPGRRRDEETRRAILRAAYQLIAKEGFRSLTMEEVAERSGASRSTIYRWWPSKGALATEAFVAQWYEEPLPAPTGSAVGDLRASMRTLARALAGAKGEVLASILGGGRDDPDIFAMCQRMATGPRRAAGIDAMRRGIASGEFRPDTNIDATLDALFLPIFVRALLRLGPCDDAWVEEHSKAVLEGAMGTWAEKPGGGTDSPA